MSDGLDINLDSPLEVRLKELVQLENAHNEFPYTGDNRFELYSSIKSQLQRDYYRDIDGALTKDSGGGAYTRHDLGHVDDVIRKAGQVLGANSDAVEPAMNRLKPYEVFVLLVACLIHDAGNIDGRNGHANRARRVLQHVAGNRLDTKEISLISKIARAHGGKTTAGSPDTIGELPIRDGVEHITVKPRLLAATLRLADELAENVRRANRRDEEGSRFPNLFCSTISVSVDYKGRWISLDFAVGDENCILFGKDEKGDEMFLLDYISRRVEKTELERRYCDRYLRGFATYDGIRVNVELLKDHDEWRAIYFELMEDGYPTSNDLESFRRSKIDGKSIATEYRAQFGGDSK
ncbi:HD domain-containing protein [Pelagimonas varians]|uniref:HD/PDEase domain-containing protein n=1 Tax=Pelagimonas varians TaxID=696760 RepID=A0A238JVS7_9RHOB|nr:hypothetical protein [Pelagimonas varians]PYG34372.1 hypothetical protein C8N36_10122 [Pelagimonas varians]SMX34264.1 hypothetical protein PEV8663_00443 [Pelagimonas varians]